MIRGNTHTDERPAGALLLLKQQGTTTAYGFMHSRTADSLTAWDAFLEYRDAANEGPDGMLRP